MWGKVNALFACVSDQDATCESMAELKTNIFFLVYSTLIVNWDFFSFFLILLALSNMQHINHTTYNQIIMTKRCQRCLNKKALWTMAELATAVLSHMRFDCLRVTGWWLNAAWATVTLPFTMSDPLSLIQGKTQKTNTFFHTRTLSIWPWLE